MFTAFMVAITLTTVANVLVVMATAPLFTALLSRFLLGHRLPARTWTAILVAGAGIAWMYGAEISGAEPRHLLGTAIALGVPTAAAINWTLIQHASRRARPGGAPCCWARCYPPPSRCPWLGRCRPLSATWPGWPGWACSSLPCPA
jgi:drug/metabolite transporter (DMT)-like permease